MELRPQQSKAVNQRKSASEPGKRSRFNIQGVSVEQQHNSLDKVSDFMGFARSNINLQTRQSRSGNSLISKNSRVSKKDELENKIMEAKRMQEIQERLDLMEIEKKKMLREKEILEMEMKLKKMDKNEDEKSIYSIQSKTTRGNDEQNIDSLRFYDNDEKVNTWFQSCDNVEKQVRKINSNHAEYNQNIEQILLRQSIDQNLLVFSGDFQDWPLFYSHFQSTTKLLNLTPEENLCRLRKSLVGEAKRAVQGLLLSASSVDRIIGVLKKRFGRSDLIVKSMISELESLPPVRNNDFKAFTRLSDLLTNFVSTLETLKLFNYLQCPQLMEKIIQKLPYGMQMSWGEVLSRNHEDANLTDLSEWINQKAEAASYVQSINRDNFHNGNKHFQGREKPRGLLLTTEKKNFNNGKKKECSYCSKDNHTIDFCNSFKLLASEEKWKFARENNLCFCCLKGAHKIIFCRNKKKCTIENCNKYHHSLLHRETTVTEENSNILPTQTTNIETVALTKKNNPMNYKVLLKITTVTIKANGKSMKIGALFDEGSTVTLLDEEVANLMNIQGEPTNLCLRWTNDKTQQNVNSRIINCKIMGHDGNEYELKNVYTMKDLQLPTQTIDVKKFKEKWTFLENKIDDNVNVTPRLLLGQDHWNLIATREIIEGPKNAPALSKTKLGWILHGNIGFFKNRIDEPVLFIQNKEVEYIQDLNNKITEFFEAENYGIGEKIIEKLSEDETKAEKLISKVTSKVQNRWETGLLWKEENPIIPDSKPTAIQRLKYIERKMDRDPEFAGKYEEKIEEYLNKGFCKKLSPHEIELNLGKNWYIPHFGVTNENKPGKLRFVFDAASKVENKSLNDFLLTGPDLYNSLVSILWKFRENKIAVNADIQEMFHQILIKSEDQDSQRFLWRGMDRNREPDIYRMQVMIFGAVCSPYAAQYILKLNASEFRDVYPEAVKEIETNHYMDDYLGSHKSEEKAIKITQDIINIHKQGGFIIRGWTSNSVRVMESIPKDLRNNNIMEQVLLPQRILGLNWIPTDDYLTFPINITKIEEKYLVSKNIPTKREILKIIMSIYDPLGLLGHYLIRSKILMQDVWKSKIGWDDKVKENILKKWYMWLQNLNEIKNLKIPRCYDTQNFEHYRIQMHIFCDASQQAIASVVYFRLQGIENNKVQIVLVTSKTKVAPLKSMSIPRLELQAALYASRLAVTVKNEHTLKINEIFYWTDSTTVLYWLKNNPKNYKTFVSNRVQEIKRNTDVNSWRWVPSKLNVADDATRDDKKLVLSQNNRWFIGPEFLYADFRTWPETPTFGDNFDETILEKRKVVLFVCNKKFDYIPDISRFSKFTYLIRSMAYVIRFVNLCKKEYLKGEFTPEELEYAENLLIKKVQSDSFNEEYKCLSENKPVKTTSKLFSLSPIIHNGIIKICGRIENSSDISTTVKRPVILDGKHYFTKLLIRYYHCKFGHNGKELILNEIRQKYWIIQARKAVTSEIKTCIVCKRRKAKPPFPEMGQLPEHRINIPPRPFTYVGIDYFGPFHVAIGRRKEKKYGVLFTCMSIRAVHLEIADSLTTDSCVMALRRFISRRGQPKIMYSDNGTNLKATEKELRELLNNIDHNKIQKDMIAKQIIWKFIPPASPHMGGVWERLVRSIKEALRVILKEQTPRYETLLTLFAEAENLVNSRPLTYVSNNENDPESITPNHFLIGSSSGGQPPGLFNQDLKIPTKKQWIFSQKLTENFWRRWIKEYVPTLIRRTKWFIKEKTIKAGDVVVVVDDTAPRNFWPLGKITKTYPGKDGQVRVVDVKTATGQYRRPVTKICPLLEDDLF